MGQAGSRGTIEIRFYFREAPVYLSRLGRMDGELCLPVPEPDAKYSFFKASNGFFLEVERKEYESQNTH